MQWPSESTWTCLVVPQPTHGPQRPRCTTRERLQPKTFHCVTHSPVLDDVLVAVLVADDVCVEEEEEEDMELLVLVPVLVLDPELVAVDVDVPVGQG